MYISYSNKKIDVEYIWKRLKGVYFPYLLMKFILLFGYYILGIQQEFSVKNLLQILLVEDWFIQVIVLEYILFFLLVKFFPRRYLVLYSFVADVVLSVIFVMQDKTINYLNSLWLFTAGMLAAQCEAKIVQLYQNAIYPKIGVMLVLFGVSGLVFAVNKGAFWANAVKPLSGVCLCLALCGVFRVLTLRSPLLRWSGVRSMYLYIVHITVWRYTSSVSEPVPRMWLTVLFTLVLTEILYQTLTRLMDHMFTRISRG